MWKTGHRDALRGPATPTLAMAAIIQSALPAHPGDLPIFKPFVPQASQPAYLRTLHLSGLSDGLNEDKGGFGVVRNDEVKSWYIV